VKRGSLSASDEAWVISKSDIKANKRSGSIPRFPPGAEAEKTGYCAPRRASTAPCSPKSGVIPGRGDTNS
jgi:hypothetical protein